MKYTPFLIGNYDQGWVNNRKSYMIPEAAFSSLENAYIFRGRVKKKYGNTLLGRLRRCLTGESLTAAIAGTNYTEDIKTVLGLEADATLQPGSLTLAIGGIITVTDDGDGTLTKTGGSATLDDATSSINYQTMVVTINLSAGAFVGGEAATADFCYYPNLPVMGLKLRERANINNEQLVAFDTTYAYIFTGGQFQELPSTPAKTWTGGDSDFFQTTNFENPGTQRLFWATNFDGITYNDPLAYYDDSVPQWVNFTPTINAGGDTLLTGKVILPYKERMLVFNTVEFVGAVNTFYPQRVRYSQTGNIIDGTNGWLSDVQGRGGFVDAPTSQAIIAVGQIRDRLIVYFERSTWELYYTGNEITPFAWRKINEELGAESTNSLIQFDNSVLGVGNVGIHSCNSDQVVRIDNEIPIQVYDFYNQEAGYNRVYGIRDFFNEIVIWSYRTAREENVTDKFPNRQLIYNYRDSNWGGPWKDSHTCFGYHQRVNDVSWQDLTQPWQVTNTPWYLSNGDSLFQTIVGGNQQGFVQILSSETSGVSASRYISAVVNGAGVVTVTSPDHNLEEEDFIKIENDFGLTWTPNDFGENIFQVTRVTGDDTFEIETQVAGTYIGGLTYLKLDNMFIRTKFFIPSWKEARSLSLNYVDFLFATTAAGKITYGLYINDDTSVPVNDPDLATGLFGDPGEQNVIRTYPEDDQPFQSNQRSIWHRSYSSTECQTCQIQLYLNEDQMEQEVLATSPFEMNAMILYVRPVDGML